MMSDNKSLTWAAHLRILCTIYQLPDPLQLLDGSLWSKQRWKDHTQEKVLAYHEAILRKKALSNSKLRFLNVQLSGLSGRIHPTLSGINTTQDVVRSRQHIKMLSGDYLCYATLAKERGSDPQCKICPSSSLSPAPKEDIIHILTRCRGTAEIRQRIIPELLNAVLAINPLNDILQKHDHLTLTQFILDCFSPNLPNSIRIAPNIPEAIHILRICRNMCFAIHCERIRQLKIRGFIEETKMTRSK